MITSDRINALNVVWSALETYRCDLIPEGDKAYDAQWNEICTAMAFLTEELGIDSSLDLDELVSRGEAL